MKRFTLLLVISCLTLIVMAKEGPKPATGEKDQVCELKGQVVDKINGEVLAGVAVKLTGSDKVTYTDFDGEFSFEGLTPGTYTLETALVSYKEEQVAVHTSTSSDNTVEISLVTISE